MRNSDRAKDKIDARIDELKELKKKNKSFYRRFINSNSDTKNFSWGVGLGLFGFAFQVPTGLASLGLIAPTLVYNNYKDSKEIDKAIDYEIGKLEEMKNNGVNYDDDTINSSKSEYESKKQSVKDYKDNRWKNKSKTGFYGKLGLGALGVVSFVLAPYFPLLIVPGIAASVSYAKHSNLKRQAMSDNLITEADMNIAKVKHEAAKANRQAFGNPNQTTVNNNQSTNQNSNSRTNSRTNSTGQQTNTNTQQNNNRNQQQMSQRGQRTPQQSSTQQNSNNRNQQQMPQRRQSTPQQPVRTTPRIIPVRPVTPGMYDSVMGTQRLNDVQNASRRNYSDYEDAVDALIRDMENQPQQENGYQRSLHR